MNREESLEEISDGKFYSENDMVKVDTGDCEGCAAACCKGMGNSICLDPYDVYRMAQHLQTDPANLLSKALEIGMVDGIMLPHLKMQENTGGCTFLDENHRCSIHEARPSVCRLFPLGRYWEDETHFSYILQKGQCQKSPLTKIKVKKWIGVAEGAWYNDYLAQWHAFLCRIKDAVAQIAASQGEQYETQIKTICMYTLRSFFMTPFGLDCDFYEEFMRRLQKAYQDFGMVD